jgi:hypothetical protein
MGVQSSKDALDDAISNYSISYADCIPFIM